MISFYPPQDIRWPSSGLRVTLPLLSKDVVLGTYQRLPRELSKLVLLDFSKVGYINSSGITLVIQLLMEAYQSARKIYAFGLSPHFTKVFTVAGITDYAGLFHSEAEALKAL